MSVLMPIGVICHQLGLLYTDMEASSRWFTNLTSSWGEQTSLALSNLGSEPFSYVVVMVDYAGSVVVLLYRHSMILIWLSLMLYSLMVAHKGACQTLSWFSRARSGANFPPIVAQKKFCNVGVLEFLQTEPDPSGALVFHPLEVESEGHHNKLMVTFSISSWKAPDLLQCSHLTGS